MSPLTNRFTYSLFTPSGCPAFGVHRTLEYRVPSDGLVEFIPNLIKVRNKIVHKGFHERSTDNKSLSTYLSAAEELLRRIFLSLLDYEGDYHTYFGIVDFRPFKKLPANVTR